MTCSVTCSKLNLFTLAGLPESPVGYADLAVGKGDEKVALPPWQIIHISPESHVHAHTALFPK